jgi:hypothetical protein
MTYQISAQVVPMAGAKRACLFLAVAYDGLPNSAPLLSGLGATPAGAARGLMVQLRRWQRNGSFAVSFAYPLPMGI